MKESVLQKQARELRELREKMGKNPEVLKTPVTKAKGLRIISIPVKERTPEEIKARREYFAKKAKEPLKQSLRNKLKDFKIAA